MRKKTLVPIFLVTWVISGCGVLGHRVGLDTVNSDIVFGHPSPSPRAARTTPTPPPAPPLPDLGPATPTGDTLTVVDLVPRSRPNVPVVRPDCPEAPPNQAAPKPTRGVDPKVRPAVGTYKWAYQTKLGDKVTSGFENHYIRNVSAVTHVVESAQQQQVSGNTFYDEFTYQEVIPYVSQAGPKAVAGFEVESWKVRQPNKYYDATDPESGVTLTRVDYVTAAGVPIRAPFAPPAGAGLLYWPLPLQTGAEPTYFFTVNTVPGGPTPPGYGPQDFRSAATDSNTRESYKIMGTSSQQADLVDACGKLVSGFSAESQIDYLPPGGGSTVTNKVHYTVANQMGGMFIFRGSSNSSPDPNNDYFYHLGQVVPSLLPSSGLPPA